MTGTIKTRRADKGFWLFRDTAGREVFFHASAIYGEGIDNLREGDGVEFDLGEASAKGLRANERPSHDHIDRPLHRTQKFTFY